MVDTVIRWDSQTLVQALARADELKMSLDAFVAMCVRDATGLEEADKTVLFDVAALVGSATAAIKALPVKTEFTLEDVASEDWAHLTGGQRKSLGKAFRKAVETSDPQIAIWDRRTSANKAVYRRV
jgi:hypothetical protein